MRRAGRIDGGSVVARLLYGLTIGAAGVVALYAIGLLVIALAAALSGWWPERLMVDTPIPGVTLPTATAYGRSMYLAQGLSRAALLAGVFVPLLGLLRSILHATPFIAANVVRLRVMAATFVVAALVQAAGPLSGSIPLMIVGGAVAPSFAWMNLFATLALLVAAELFQEGVRLRDDADATI